MIKCPHKPYLMGKRLLAILYVQASVGRWLVWGCAPCPVFTCCKSRIPVTNYWAAIAAADESIVLHLQTGPAIYCSPGVHLSISRPGISGGDALSSGRKPQPDAKPRGSTGPGAGLDRIGRKHLLILGPSAHPSEYTHHNIHTTLCPCRVTRSPERTAA